MRSRWPDRSHGNHNPARIASITPLPIARDSRTFKAASSFARLDYASVVVQGAPGPSPSVSPLFELMTVGSGDHTEDGETVVTDPDNSSVQDPITEFVPPPKRTRPGHFLPISIQRLIFRAYASPFAYELRKYRNWAASYLQFLRDTYRSLPDADLYYLHAPHQFPAVYLAARRRGVPFIYDAHDCYWLLPYDGRVLSLSDRWIFATERLVERLCAKTAAACVTVGDGVAALHETRFKRPFAVVRNAQDTRMDEAPARSLRSLCGLNASDFVLVVVGNDKERGIAITEAVDALAQLPSDVHLVLLGTGYADAAERARTLDLAGRVHRLPPVTPAAVNQLIAGADLAPILNFEVNANMRFAVPNRLFHSIAAGLPILYPPLPEIRSLAERHGFGLEFNPLSPDSLADAVRGLRADQTARADLARRSVEARSTINWEAGESRLADVVAMALERR